jgi:hypothetical protein
MTACRDWPSTIFKSSFRGAPFEVDTDTQSGGQRMVIHEYPNRDVWDVEKLGRRAKQIDVTAFTYGDNADADADRVVRACDGGTPGTLILPTMAAQQATCMTCERGFAKDTMGRITLHMHFVLESGGIGGLFSFQFLFGAMTSAVSAAVGQASVSFATTYNGLNVPNVAREAAAVTIEKAATAIGDMAAMLPLDPTVAPTVRHEVGLLVDDAYVLAQQGEGQNVVTATTFSATQRVIDHELGDRLADLIAMISAACPDRLLLMAKLGELTNFVPQYVVPGPAPSVAAEIDLTGRVARLIRVLATVKWAEVMTVTKYETRNEAVAARAVVADKLAIEIDTALDLDEYTSLSNVRDISARYITRNGAELPRIAHIELPTPSPTLCVAYELYGDPLRDEDIINRNAIVHPMFSTPDMEVLIQ